jgi:hypothetical protein
VDAAANSTVESHFLFYRLIIEEFVNYHSIDMNSLCAAAGNGLHFDDTRSPLFPSVREWLSQLPDTYADQSKQAKYEFNSI